MKTILLILIVLFTYSCKSCYECTRFFTKNTYQRDVLGEFQHIGIYSDGVDQFEECDKENIKAVELITPSEKVTIDNDNYYLRTSKCSCVKK